MGSNYNGVGANFFTGLTLQTDNDSPSASVFRLPSERLLDNCVHLRGRLDATDATEVRARLRNALVLQLADPTAVTSEQAVAAVAHDQSFGTLVLKSGASNVRLHGDGGGIFTSGAVASITSLVTDAAENPNTQRVVAIGTGGNFNCFSADYGLNWTAGGTLGNAARRIIWNNFHGRYQVQKDSTNSPMFSTDAVSWGTGTTNLQAASSGGGIACLSDGTSVICGVLVGSATAPAFVRSTNFGTTWADGSGTVQDPTTYQDHGSIAGNGGSRIWHVGRRTGAGLRVSITEDGNTWGSIANITAIGTGTAAFGSKPRLMCCQNTGLLVIAAPLSGGFMALYASLDGGTVWSSPVTAGPLNISVNSFALAGGRLYSSSAASMFASAGVGYP